jgi:signal transduction histidine kinase
MPKESLPVSDALTDAIVALNAQLDLPHVLDKFLEASTEHTGARYSAINVLNEEGVSIDFHYTGMDPHVWQMLGRAPNSVGVLSQIPADGTLRIDEITTHPSFEGLPKGHPPLGAFLGTALKVRGHVFGYLYLANKEGGFTPRDEAVVQALAAATSVAIDNAQLYEDALARERWLEASQTITTSLLANPGDEEAFAEIVEAARDLAGATHVALVLPGVENEWVMEFTTGPAAGELLGLVLPQDGFAMTTIRSGEGTIAAEPPGGTILEPVRGFGATLYAPLRAQGRTVGLLMLWRDRGQPAFDDHDLTTAQRFANQAALALSLAELSHVKNVTSMLEDRERLADDLHDFVSQELFATAIQLETIAENVPAEFKPRLLGVLDHVKRAQREVRGVMSSLAGQRTSEPLSERVRRDLVMAQDSLGFAPTVQVEWASVSHAIAGDPTLSDDVCAVVRELLSNVVRHADALAVHLTIEAKDGRLVVRTTDDGIGPAGAQQRHSGTSNLANRAIRRRGTFTLSAVRPGSDRPGTVAEWNVEAPG